VGSDWLSENMMLASSVSGACRRGKEREEVELPKGCSEGKRAPNMKPLPGAGSGDVREK
jgi:hypothetical protein